MFVKFEPWFACAYVNSSIPPLTVFYGVSPPPPQSNVAVSTIDAPVIQTLLSFTSPSYIPSPSLQHDCLSHVWEMCSLCIVSPFPHLCYILFSLLCISPLLVCVHTGRGWAAVGLCPEGGFPDVHCAADGKNGGCR